jgi:hypothetical protein
VDRSSIPLRKFEKGPGYFGAMATRRIARGEVVTNLRGVPPVKERTLYSIQIDQFHHLDTWEPEKRCYDDFINHGCSPNLFFDVGTLEFRAIRDIEPGEEVLLNYCATEEELPEPFTCNCGSPDCYGVVSGFRLLSRTQQESLKGLVSPWLKTKYGL